MRRNHPGQLIKAGLLTLAVATIRTNAQDPTMPVKQYAGDVSFAEAPVRENDRYPLSDQKNQKGWALRPDLSDEFAGPALDSRKWFPTNPTWIGRPPTFFHAANVSLKDGELALGLNHHGDTKLPEGFTHTSGYIKSRNRALYGYFEAEMKLMDAAWVSGFWLTHRDPDWWTEIDICENCPGVPANRRDLNSNVHVFKSPPEQGNVTEHFALSKKYRLPFELQAGCHVWGLEWDAEFIRFYLDGVLFREQPNTHWHQPLSINFNCESNKWFGALPDDAGLRAEMRVKYFRTWRRASRPE